LLGSLVTAIYGGEVGRALPGSAFADGLHVAAAVSAAVLVALAVFARLQLGRPLARL
jgi:hypothetical protein